MWGQLHWNFSIFWWQIHNSKLHLSLVLFFINLSIIAYLHVFEISKDKILICDFDYFEHSENKFHVHFVLLPGIIFYVYLSMFYIVWINALSLQEADSETEADSQMEAASSAAALLPVLTGRSMAAAQLEVSVCPPTPSPTHQYWSRVKYTYD